MTGPLHFMMQHPYIILGAWVFADQMGLPMPSIPLLMAAGVLAERHAVHGWIVFTIGTLTAIAADLLWFEIGRFRGASVLSFLCRISLEPDSCVRRTEALFSNRGARALVFAKFVPGLGTAGPPLAGMIGMKMRRFLLWDSLGAVIWAGGFIALGMAFHRQLDLVARYANRLGEGLLILLVGPLGLYIAWKYIQRQRFLRRLRIARISPEELKRKLDTGEEMTIVDLRHSLDFEADPHRIPGSLRMTVEDFEQRHIEIPRDRDIILYCT